MEGRARADNCPVNRPEQSSSKQRLLNGRTSAIDEVHMPAHSNPHIRGPDDQVNRIPKSQDSYPWSSLGDIG